MTTGSDVPFSEAALPPPRDGFACPLRCYQMPAALPPFESYAACNVAVAAYQSASPQHRDHAAEDLYARLLPLVRKSLRRFCHPFYEESRCYSGACYPEELIGESYLWFREALDEFDVARGVDFVGFAARRLFWAGEHRVRGLQKNWYALTTDGMPEDIAKDDSEEDKLLGRTLADSLLAQLEPRDAELARRAAEGYTSGELADWAGVSEAGVRKRLERIRERLRKSVKPAPAKPGDSLQPEGP